MGAPNKEGLEYFSFDVDLLDNDDLDDLRVEYGVVVNDVFIGLLTLLYRKKGYYIPYETAEEKKECVKYIYKRVRGGKYPVKREAIPTVIEAIVAQGLFDRDHFNKIITSERAQKTYYKATVDRKLESFDIRPEYWLLDDKTMRKLSQRHPYYLSLHPENKSDDYQNKSVDYQSKSTEEQVKETKLKETIIPPSIPPKGEEREGKADFMKAYPLLAAWKKYDDSGVDYKLLSERFANSSRLQKTYSMKWVCENYQAIVSGAFADKPDSELTKGEWENWLSERRDEAERAAENVLARATADYEFNEAHKELSSLTIKLAFAEVKGGGQQAKIKARIAELEETERARIKELGINEKDFKPKYHCKHCNDTGYLPDGHLCKECWEKFKENRNG